MKLSVNQGPYVGESNMGFTISVAHLKEVSGLLFDWVEGLPTEVSSLVEAIVVGPYKIAHPSGDRISIKVFMSRGFHHQVGSGQQVLGWKNQAEVQIYCYSPNMDIGRRWEETKRDLDEAVCRIIRREAETYKAIASSFEKIVGLMAK